MSLLFGCLPKGNGKKPKFKSLGISIYVNVMGDSPRQGSEGRRSAKWQTGALAHPGVRPAHHQIQFGIQIIGGAKQ